MTARVRVIIVSYNSGRFLPECLKALACQSFTDFEAVVGDNASTDGFDVAAHLPDDRFRLMQMPTNIGFARANNEAARGAQCRWLALLNPDAFPAPDWLEKLVTTAESRPEFSMFGSTQLNADNPEIYDGTGDWLPFWGIPWRSHFGQPVRRPHPQGEIFAPCAAAALYDRTLFERVGGFDARFFCYTEDVDLGLRMRLTGARALQVGDAVVRHVGSGIVGRGSRFAIGHAARNQGWLIAKSYPLILLPFGLLANLCALALASVTTHRAHFRTIWGGVFAGWRGMRAALRDRRQVQAARRLTSWQVLRLLDLNPVRFWKKGGRRLPRVADRR